MTGNRHHIISAFLANQYTSLFKSLVEKIDVLFAQLNNDFLVTTNKVTRYNALAREKMQAKDVSDLMRVKLRGATKSFDAIIMALQFHDIIRQKLEHIQTTHTLLSDEFSAVYEQRASHLRLILVMPQLVELSHAQLIQIKDDYMQAANKIQRLLRSLWADREISRELHLFLFNTNENLRNVVSTVDLLIGMHQKLAQLSSSFPVDVSSDVAQQILQDIKQIYTMDSEREVFNKTFNIEEEFETTDDVFF